jgi:prophage regulatory protein
MRTVRERYNNPDRLLRSRDVCELIGFARPTLYKFIRERNFPKPIGIGDHSKRWIESEVQEWIEDQINAYRLKSDSKRGNKTGSKKPG